MTTTTTNSKNPSDIVAESTFLQELARQVRAYDTFGVYSKWTDELVLAAFVVSKERKSKISLEGEVDPATQLRILCFYRTIAMLVEKETGQLCQVVIDLNHEGFGWALVWSGRLMVTARSLRDAHRFGYVSLAKLAAQGERLVKSGIEAVRRFPEAADA
ncbi:MAG: NifX-associated nitrogen fixation protein [Prochloraceae cyanobacterium]|nr:NifX-associated nitrogen fixation protein [Prochloraceae cyanobacterium]